MEVLRGWHSGQPTSSLAWTLRCWWLLDTAHHTVYHIIPAAWAARVPWAPYKVKWELSQPLSDLRTIEPAFLEVLSL